MNEALKAPSKRAVEEAKAALAAAAKESADCKARVAEFDATIRKAGDDYDREPIEAYGDAVIAARKARELACIRSERADRREKEAQAAVTSAEQAHAVASAEHATAVARVEAVNAAQELKQARDVVAREVDPELLRKAVLAHAEIAASARSLLSAAEEKHIKTHRKLAESQKRLAGLAGEAGTESGSAAETVEAVHAVMMARASVGTFHANVSHYATMLTVGARLMLDGMRGMVAALEETNVLATEARTAKLAAPELDKAHVASAALLALCEALPEALPITWASGVIAGELLCDQSMHGRGFASNRPLGWLLNVWCSAEVDGGPPRLAINQRDARDADAAREQIREALSFAKPIDARLAREARAEKDK